MLIQTDIMQLSKKTKLIPNKIQSTRKILENETAFAASSFQTINLNLIGNIEQELDIAGH